MIIIAGNTVDTNVVANQYPPGSVEYHIYSLMSESSYPYRYDTPQQLQFELDLRKKIIKAAIDLNNSRFSFKTFRKSICNEDYWIRTDEGGFLLRRDVKPSDAIADIYLNSSLYGTECATAMVIIYYKALLDIYPANLFNRLFSSIYLMNWQHLDSNIGINSFSGAPDYFPGDGRYFKNPDVDPLTPEWQGENVIDLGKGMYYGHGVGIRTAEGVIHALNKHRINGSETPAYLMDLVKRPNFKRLAFLYENFISP